MEPVLHRVVGVAMLLLGLWFIVLHRRAKAQLERSRWWPSVPGEVTESEVQRHSGKVTTYEARIVYRYHPGDRERTGRAITIGSQVRSSRRARAERRCERYPVGSRPAVYFDPADPGVSCLERVYEGGRLMWLPAAFFLGGGLFLLVGPVPTRR